MALSVIILAAGKGKRMHSDLPKVLQPLGGQPLLQHVVDTAARLPQASLHVVYGHGGERVTESLAHLDVTWVEQPDQLGTGHAVAQALPRVPEDDVVLILYGDVPFVELQTLQGLVERAALGQLALLTVELDDPSGYGRVVRDSNGAIQRIVEHRDAGADELAIHEVNTGLMACPAAMLRPWVESLENDNAQREYYLTDVIARAVAEDVQVAGIVAAHADEVMGINDRMQLAAAESTLRRFHAQRLLAAGVTLLDPSRIDVRGGLICGRDVVIDVNTVFEGEVRLGDRVRIGPNCVIRDAQIGDDTVVDAFSHIESATVGARGRIGPYARLRPAARLADDVHVGNFVEIKKSEVGRGSKANHLAYIGDSVIGERVNVGAGTITCNYDGVNKHQTVIGDEVFIGSDTQLVAPVTIGAGATIGAGSTITRDVPPGKLAISRSRQTLVPGWQRPVKK